MNRAKLICAILLALPLIVFGLNFFLPMFEGPPAPDNAGARMLQSMCDNGLMAWVAASHVLIGLLLLNPRTRFSAGLLQLPLSIGILAFHATMMPEGLPIAVVMLALNSVVIADGAHLRALLGQPD